MSTATAARTYEYRARDGKGKVVKGRVEAGSESAVIARLAGMGVAPLSIREVGTGTGLQTEITLAGFERGVGLKDLAIMSRQMSTMISAGLSILQTLNILASQTENKKLAKTLGEVRSDVERGNSLSDSFARHERVFPPLMINLIRAGETGGFLEKSTDAIAMNFEKEVALRNKVKAALTYPVIVLVMAIVGVILMLAFIVPVFAKMYGDLGGQLPLPTQILVTLSGAMVWLAPTLAVLIVAFSIWWSRNKHKESVREVVDPIKLKLPVFGTLTAKIAIARFARNFSTMIGSGVPILRSLSIVGETSGNMVIQKALLRVQESVRTGGTVAAPLLSEPVFPAMVTQMMAVGEDAGALEPMLEKIAVFYDSEVEAMTDQLTALIEPLMIAFLGIVIGGMIVALYMPMFGIIGEVQGA
ncbi:type IV pilus assembly protein PilC [Microbacteriaceae bacterium SG_E_30_P1]|uniref:Type IV pilus assembly protein PilC n=1 Tax=Antiquaquibacter oligotrophicus TaxID=2880260 RepID=A0ABT6KJP3_9MICO|nr:type II secretion system F family protein [Antiquaquibacter oligotrophicus]MDH6179891.1 type IV pilus assembly protein PilC [Antiquaquibacter oligotrophicus]UDF14347.1 type II secretion system F family protein [Antiquaquibacter oligotrophicus]